MASMFASATWPAGAIVAMTADAWSTPRADTKPATAARGKPFATLVEHVGMQVSCIPRLLLAHVAYSYLLGDWRTTAQTFAWSWMWPILARDVALCWLVGLVTDYLHLSPGSPFVDSMRRHKYSTTYSRWFVRNGSSAILRDAFWSTISALIAGLMECGVLHAYATGLVKYADVDATGGWWRHTTTVVLMVSWFYTQNIQFYTMHRLLHKWGTTSIPDVGAWLYKHVHALHHVAKNPTAFSGIAMHPVEGALYFSYALFPLLFGAHPMAFLYIKTNLIAAAMLGHSGFEDPAQGSQPHFIHHQHVHVNYAEAHLPIDWLLGTFAADEEEAHRSMERRLALKRGAEAQEEGEEGCLPAVAAQPAEASHKGKRNKQS